MSACLKSRENEHLLHLALGLIIASYLTLFLAGHGWLDRNLVFIAMAAVIVIRIKKISEALNLTGRKALRFIKNLSAYEKVLFIILILQAGINFFLTLTPPTGWDSLAYHLTIPKLILREGRIIHYADYGGASYPLLVEMIFTLGLLIHGAGLVKLICWSISVLTVMAIYNLAAKIGLKSIGLIAGLIFYNTQVVSMWAGECYIDITFAFFVTLAAIILIEFYQKKERSLLLVWLFIAILPGIKFNGLILSFIMGAYLIWQILIQEKNIKGIIKAVSLGVLIILVFNSPWYFKERRFGPDKAILYASVLEKPSMVEPYLQRWVFTLGRFTLNCDRDGRIGPFFLGFLPLLILVRPLRKEILLLLTISLAYVAIFLFFGYLFPRYVVPVMPLLGIVAAYVVMKLEAGDKVLRYFLMGCLTFTFIFNVGLTLYNHRLELSYLIGKISENDFLNTKVECYPAINYINQNIHQGTILLIGETRGYYLERPFRLAYVAKGDKSEKLEKLIKRYNITHILLNERVICNKKADISVKEFLEYFASRLELIYTKGFFKIYRVYNK